MKYCERISILEHCLFATTSCQEQKQELKSDRSPLSGVGIP